MTKAAQSTSPQMRRMAHPLVLRQLPNMVAAYFLALNAWP